MNLVVFQGRLTKDPDLKFTSKGTAVTNFTLAVDKGYGDNKKTAFLPCIVWGKAGEYVANYAHKGSNVLFKGSVETRSYDAKDGTKRYVTEFVADMFEGIKILDTKEPVPANSQTGNETPQDYFGEDVNYTEVTDVDDPF